MGDELDRACEAAWDATQRRRPASDLERFGVYPWWSVKDDETGDAVRDSIAAALRVMAEDVRKQTSVWRSNDGGGDMDANALEVQVMLLCADQIDLIIDAYVGDINDQ